MRSWKQDIQAQLDSYFGTVHGFYRVYLLNKKNIVHTKPAKLHEESFLAGMNASKILPGCETEIPYQQRDRYDVTHTSSHTDKYEIQTVH